MSGGLAGDQISGTMRHYREREREAETKRKEWRGGREWSER